MIQNLTAEQHQALVDSGQCRVSFMCTGATTHDKCRGYFLTADWQREPCECEHHGGDQ
jgi:hypothetical protein